MGTVSLRNAQTDNGGEAFGVAAESIRLFSYRDANSTHTERDPAASWNRQNLGKRIA